MQCVTPMIRYYLDKKLLPETTKKWIEENEIKLPQKIIPRDQVLRRLCKNENTIRRLENLNKNLETQGSLYRYQAIPCGHCYACKLKYSAEWATRIMAECSMHEHNYFITFTYNEENLPIPNEATYEDQTYINPGDWDGTLYPDDITKFINSLRKRKEREGHTGIKYFYAGEYCPGENGTKRPHYHMILMNCPLNIKQFYKFKLEPSTKKLHWRSHEIEELWNKGFIDIGEVEWSSAAYVARYCMKKLSNEVNKRSYYEQGKLPEFVRMSRRPGIGAEYYNIHKEEIYKTDSIIMKNFHGEIANYKPPKAWDRKFEKEHPEAWEMIKQSREEAAKRAAKLEREITNYTDKERLEMQAQDILRRAKQLPRSLAMDY